MRRTTAAAEPSCHQSTAHCLRAVLGRALQRRLACARAAGPGHPLPPPPSSSAAASALAACCPCAALGDLGVSIPIDRAGRRGSKGDEPVRGSPTSSSSSLPLVVGAMTWCAASHCNNVTAGAPCKPLCAQHSATACQAGTARHERAWQRLHPCQLIDATLSVHKGIAGQPPSSTPLSLLLLAACCCTLTSQFDSHRQRDT